jgi:hypothetical protein
MGEGKFCWWREVTGYFLSYIIQFLTLISQHPPLPNRFEVASHPVENPPFQIESLPSLSENLWRSAGAP